MNYQGEVKKKLSYKRYEHTIGVKDTAIFLARKWGADEYKAEVAALFHDWARELKDEELLQVAKTNGITLSTDDNLAPHVLHGKIGAILVNTEFGINDSEILNAISNHTLGNTNMSLLDKIIFVADMIEPNRDYPGIKRIRELAESNLDKALLAGLDHTLNFLIDREKYMHYQTIEARNNLLSTLLKP